MSFQRVHQSSPKNPQISPNSSGFTPHRFSIQPTQKPLTQQEIENQVFEQDNFEATGLQLKEKDGTITPVEQERLGVLQAKMDNLWAQRTEKAKAQPNLLKILIGNTQATSATTPATPIQPKLTIKQPLNQYEQKVERVTDSAIQIPESRRLAPPIQNLVHRRTIGQKEESEVFDNAVGISQETAEIGIFTSRLQRQEDDPNKPVFDRYKGENINKIGHISAPMAQYKTAKTSGVNVRAQPDGTLLPIAKVIYDTEVHVQALDNTGAFYFIIANTGVVGWINKDFVALDPPDIGSRLHHITESNLTTILKNEYVDKGLWELSTGNDYTTLAAAVVVANQGRKGVSVDWAKAQKYKEEHTWKRFLDPWMIDNFAIYHGSEILAGHNIWLPSPNYVRMLQSSGVIGSRPDWLNTVVDIGHGIAGFSAGLVSGIFGSLWDTLTGLWELGKSIVNTVKSILDGSLFSSIKSIYDTVTNMTWQDFENMVNEVITMGKNAFDNFAKQWNHPDVYKKWHFRGYTIGAIALEVVLAIFTGGATLGAKVLAKIGKYFPKLMQILRKLLNVADELHFRRNKDRHHKSNKHHDDDHDKNDHDMSHDDRSWEQARILAAILTEEHDTMDTPVETLIPILNTTIGARFKGVRGYKAIPIGEPNTYKIIQMARRRNVDDHYTEKKKAPKLSFFTHLQGKSLKRIQDRAKEIGWKYDDNLRTGKGWIFRDENGIERIRYRQDKDGSWLHEETGYIRWSDENGNFLDIVGKPVTAGGRPINLNMSQHQIRTLCADEAEFDRVMRASHISVNLL